MARTLAQNYWKSNFWNFELSWHIKSSQLMNFSCPHWIGVRALNILKRLTVLWKRANERKMWKSVRRKMPLREEKVARCLYSEFWRENINWGSFCKQFMKIFCKKYLRMKKREHCILGFKIYLFLLALKNSTVYIILKAV